MFNITNISALSYQSEIGIGFTFNPTLSVSLSSSGLVISNLIPDSSSDSNSINVSVATNASYGYTLSVNASSDYLTHSNNIDTFSSIATDANLSSLNDSEDSNIWGYSTSLDNGTSWSNYNGLSSSTNTMLIDNSNTADSTGSMDFKIAAKAGSTQASGTYTNTITFTAVTKPTPMNLAESYFAAGKTRHNGYYTMQDMTTEICTNTEVIGEGSQTQLIDIRNDKVYWATKLADGHCWMTQNLDLDLDSTRTYTHWDTDLGWSTEDGNTTDENAEWKPSSSTISTGGWEYPANVPVSLDPGEKYIYTSNSDEDDTVYYSLSDCITATNDSTGCSHSHLGNYYNWPASVANNDTSSVASDTIMPNSICAAGWKLPNTINNEYGVMLYNQGILQNPTSIYYSSNGFIDIRKSPLYFVRGGVNGGVSEVGVGGYCYLSNMSNIRDYPYYLRFSKQEANNRGINVKMMGSKTYMGASIRCLAR